MHQHLHPGRPRPSSAHLRTGRTGTVLLQLLLVAGLAAACTGSPEASGTADAAGAADGTGPAGSSDHAEHEGHDAQDGKVAVGPIALPVAEYWSVLQPADGLTEVKAGGCPEGTPCPGFEIRTGVALDGVDPEAAYVPDGATCPGADALRATATGEATPSDTEVAGTAATLTRWTLSCVDDAGEEVRTVEQLQWYVADAPEGPVLVVDRWAFEGLESRLAAGAWVGA